MPRGPRLDMPGALHHVIVRGIDKGNIVMDDTDRETFTKRMGTLAKSTGTSIYAWVLMSNHAHILLRSGSEGLSSFMRKLLTGYAQQFNRRHHRTGHLFQNRYKSILCEEEPYFLKLVAYIHLNPLRAGLVASLDELDGYSWSGHAVLMKQMKKKWQDRDYVLLYFGDKEGQARKAYRLYLEEEVHKGAQPGLVGGGLLRSAGGWSEVKSMRRLGIKQAADERVLGSGDFVRSVINEAEGHIKRQVPSSRKIEKAAAKVEEFCKKADITLEYLQSGARRQPLPKLRRELALTLVYECGLSLAETARQLGVTTGAVSRMLDLADLSR